MNRRDSRAFLVVKGDVKMDTTIVGTMWISVIWNFSMASRYRFKSNLRIMYTECCSRNAQPDINGTAKLWKAGRQIRRETYKYIKTLVEQADDRPTS